MHLNPLSLASSPSFSPGNHYFVFYICESVSFLLYSLVCFFYFLESTYKWYIWSISYSIIFLCVTYFTYHNTFHVHPCCCQWQNFILFMAGSTLYRCTVSSLSIHLLMSIFKCCFHVLAIGNNDAMNIGAHIYFWIRGLCLLYLIKNFSPHTRSLTLGRWCPFGFLYCNSINL